MLTVCLAGLLVALVVAAAILLLNIGALQPAATVRAQDVLPQLRPLTTALRPCTGCDRVTEASVHRDGRHTCLTCFAPHPAEVAS